MDSPTTRQLGVIHSMIGRLWVKSQKYYGYDKTIQVYDFAKSDIDKVMSEIKTKKQASDFITEMSEFLRAGKNRECGWIERLVSVKEERRKHGRN